MNMQVEQIKSEIEKRLKSKDFGFDDEAEYGYGECLRDLKGFINSLVEEPASDNLDKASKDILKDFGAIATTDKGLRLYSEDSMLGICKAGANWQMRQMMKDAKDATVIMTHVTNESLSPALSVVLLPDTFQEGDKVKVIIVPRN